MKKSPLVLIPGLLCDAQLWRHEEIAAAVKGARLVVIERCGHLSTLEKLAEVNAALRRWLEAQTSVDPLR